MRYLCLTGLLLLAGCSSPKMPEGPPPEYEPPRPAPPPPSAAPAPPASGSAAPGGLPPIDDD